MKNYTYDTAAGPITIEVDEKWAALLAGADTEEANSNRKHTRPDRKYTPGMPVSLDSLDYDGEAFTDRGGEIEAVELSLDMERALATLTELQRRYFILNRMEGYSLSEIARMDSISHVAVLKHINRALQKLKNIFPDGYK